MIQSTMTVRPGSEICPCRVTERPIDPVPTGRFSRPHGAARYCTNAQWHLVMDSSDAQSSHGAAEHNSSSMMRARIPLSRIRSARRLQPATWT